MCVFTTSKFYFTAYGAADSLWSSPLLDRPDWSCWNLHAVYRTYHHCADNSTGGAVYSQAGNEVCWITLGDNCHVRNLISTLSTDEISKDVVGGWVQSKQLKYLYISSRLNAHLMFRLFPENRKSIHNCFVVKTFQKCNPPDFKFDLGKLNNKTFPHMVWC